MNKQKWHQRYRIVETYLFPIILLLYPLLHANQGVDITDTGYSLGNFVFFDKMEGMWVFATYIANVTGAFLTTLPFGNTMLGMNCYTGLFVSASALLSYFFLCKKIPGWIVFIGEIMAINLCWCPTVILYNYITYLFFTIAIVCLYQGLIHKKPKFLVCAGIFLGMNVMTRFPNLAETALILSVWYFGFLRKKKGVEVLKDTGFCLLGYVIGLGAWLLVIGVKYGIPEYLHGIQKLFAMTDTASDYSAYGMVLTILLAYKTSVKWVALLLLFFLVSFACYSIFPGKLEWVKKAGLVGALLVLFRLFYAKGMFNIKYYTYESVFQWGAMFLIVSIVLYLWIMMDKRRTHEDKLIASMLLILIGITPLGSNNHLYPNLNNLFLVAPVTLFLLWNMRTKSFPVKAVIFITTLVILIQSLGFGWFFVFRDGMDGEKRNTKIENNDILEGMYTNQDNGEYISDISGFCKKTYATPKEVLLYGDIPAMSYLLHMPTAISTSWPDLDSYGLSTMKQEVSQMETKMVREQTKPLIIVSAGVGAYLLEDEEELQRLELNPESFQQDPKLKLIQGLLKTYQYQEVFTNGKFVIYQ